MLSLAVARIGNAHSVDDSTPPRWFGSSERARWTTLAPTARAAFVASRVLLRRLLRASTGVDADRWDVSAELGTEPIVRLAPSSAMPLRASLSHRLGWVAAAVSNAAVGIDLECARPVRSDPLERASLMLSPVELPAWNALPSELRESALLTRWTAKEAWFKASLPHDSAWNFRHVVARACAPEHANVRVWEAAPLHVAICCADAGELVRVECEGLDAAAATSIFLHVSRVAHVD
jgi:phosphopantetheinyl transferase